MGRPELLGTASETPAKGMTGTSLAVYYHTHWDREWYLPFRAYQLRLAEVVDEVLDRLDRNILPCFMLDGQTVLLEDYLELRPENRERLKQYVQSGQLSIGPWYVMPDEFLVSGESLIRNLTRGIRESEAWGCSRFTGYLPDTFGHSADIPTLFKYCGLDSAVVWRGVNPAQSLFLWQSPSSASVKTLHLTDGYFQFMLQDWMATDTEQVEALKGLAQKLMAVRNPQFPALMPIGGDHLGPLPAKAHETLKAHFPDIRETTPDQYLSNLTPLDNLETIHGELIDNSGSFLLPGVYSARMYLKQANRKAEHRLTHQLEPLLAMTQLLPQRSGFRYPARELGLSWKTLILNHPHDSICGCSVDAVHRENEVRFDQVAQLTDGLLNRATRHFAAACASSDEWLVFNTGDQPYTGVVTVVENSLEADAPSALTQLAEQNTVLQDAYLHDTQQIPLSHLTQTRRFGWIWAEEVPPFGFKTLSKTKPVLSSQAVQASADTLLNGLISITVGQPGTLSITDLQTGQVFNDLLNFIDKPDQGDSYNSAPVPNTEPETAKLTGYRVLQSGPMVGILELTHHFQKSDLVLVTQVQLEAESAVVRFETTFINHALNHKLQAVFATAQPVAEVVAESHLGTVRRAYDPDYREQDFVPVARMKELKTNTGPIQRFFSANGQSWITQGLTEYEVYQNSVAITFIRAFGALSSGDTGVRGAQAGPPFETPEGQCVGRTFHCQYAWLPTPSKTANLYEAASRYYGTIWGVSGAGQPDNLEPAASLIHWDNPALVMSACYWLPEKGLVLRLLNPNNQMESTRFQTGFVYRQLHETDFLERPLQALSQPTVQISAGDVKTLLFEV